MNFTIKSTRDKVVNTIVNINLFYVTLIFIVAKLIGLISWSWFWVLSPVILPLGLYIGVIILVLLFYAVKFLINGSSKNL